MTGSPSEYHAYVLGKYRDAVSLTASNQSSSNELGRRMARLLINVDEPTGGQESETAPQGLAGRTLEAMQMRRSRDFPKAIEILTEAIEQSDRFLALLEDGSNTEVANLRMHRAAARLELANVYADQWHDKTDSCGDQAGVDKLRETVYVIARGEHDAIASRVAAVDGTCCDSVPVQEPQKGRGCASGVSALSEPDATPPEPAMRLGRAAILSESHALMAVGLEHVDAVASRGHYRTGLQLVVKAHQLAPCVDIAHRFGLLLASLDDIPAALDLLIPAMLVADGLRFEVTGAGLRASAATARDRIREDVLRLLAQQTTLPRRDASKLIAEVIETCSVPGVHRAIPDGEMLNNMRSVLGDAATGLDMTPPPVLRLPWGVALEKYYAIAQQWVGAQRLRMDTVVTLDS